MPQIEFTKIIKGRTSAVIEDGTLLTGEDGSFVFDRSRPCFETELRQFLEAQAKAGTIWKGDVNNWLDWLVDDGTATVSSSTKKIAPKHRVFQTFGHGFDVVE